MQMIGFMFKLLNSIASQRRYRLYLSELNSEIHKKKISLVFDEFSKGGRYGC